MKYEIKTIIDICLQYADALGFLERELTEEEYKELNKRLLRRMPQIIMFLIDDIIAGTDDLYEKIDECKM